MTDGPRVLASTGPLFMTPLDYVMDAVAEAGFDAVEIMVSQNAATQRAYRITESAAKAGLSVPVLHGPFLLVLRNVFGRAFAAKASRSMEMAAEIGADLMVAHAPFRFEVRSRRWLAEEVQALQDRTGVTLAVENLYPFRGRAVSSAISIEDMRAYDSVVMDTSHCAVAGIDILQMWRELKDRIVHLHVADNFGTGKDSHAPIGSGVLPLQELLAEVGASGWTGTITLELDFRAFVGDRAKLVGFLARQREIALAALAGDLVVS